jgi:hypothetical protein
MSILARFTPADLTQEKYQEVNRRLEENGDGSPDGRQLHVCFGEEGNLKVSEIWESQEKIEAFGERLMPVLAEVGVQMGAPPEFVPVVNLIEG